MVSYFHESVDLLMSTVSHFLDRNPSGVFLTSYMSRFSRVDKLLLDSLGDPKLDLEVWIDDGISVEQAETLNLPLPADTTAMLIIRSAMN